MKPHVEIAKLPLLPVASFKGAPNRKIAVFSKGRKKASGNGLAGWFVTTSTSLTSVPTGTIACPFAVKALSADHQNVTVTGTATFRVADPDRLGESFDFSVGATGAYLSEDPEKIGDRLSEILASTLFSAAGKKDLQKIISLKDELSGEVGAVLASEPALEKFGIALNGLAITSLRPSPDIEKAMEALRSEALKQEADSAVHARQLAAELKDRKLKEEQIKTSKFLQDNEREVLEAKMETARRKAELEREVQVIELETESARFAHAQSQRIHEAQTSADIAKIQTLVVEEQAKNTATLGEARGQALQAAATALDTLDAKKLQALALQGGEGQGAIGAAFLEMAEKAEKIGTLNISPDLLQCLLPKANP